ncbi:hypothetical protein NC653_004633 [Populus alba x Populus x berolinensis]|uniref:Uncharacterized protein n=1 Tax=Populus alba x Populus x berolinensis TaxID=444605 RepID=A0AAD6RUG0_9ROSI|nr:hypothetical protein NC653_004633 [Populus alba x Populus x berolinensis]
MRTHIHTSLCNIIKVEIALAFPLPLSPNRSLLPSLSLHLFSYINKHKDKNPNKYTDNKLKRDKRSERHSLSAGFCVCNAFFNEFELSIDVNG